VKLLEIICQDFSDLWPGFTSLLEDLQRAIREMPKKLTLETLKIMSDSAELQQLQRSLKCFRDILDDPITMDLFPYWPEYSGDVKRVLGEVEHYIQKFLEAGKRPRSPNAGILREIEKVIRFFKSEFEHLHPRSWRGRGLRTLRDVQKGELLVEKMRLLKISEQDADEYRTSVTSDDGKATIGLGKVEFSLAWPEMVEQATVMGWRVESLEVELSTRPLRVRACP
jgi:hypothetical protein